MKPRTLPQNGGKKGLRSLGRTPMETVTSDTYENRLAVRRSAEAAAFGFPPPPNEADRDFCPYTIKWT